MTIYAGIDIAKKNLDVALPEEKKTKRFANDVEGIKACIQLLQEANVDVAVVERLVAMNESFVKPCLPLRLAMRW